MYGGGAAAQYPVYGGTNAMVTGTNAFYPYFQFGQGGGAAPYANGQSYGMQYPQMFQYSAMATSAVSGFTGFAAQHYGGPLSPPAQPAGL